ncbi:MAG: hypothetical protein HZY76_19955 [Anaerolineae bacterium]|nr:MAG: hypothetical protein HZY76_19955 [Anaerolineae bacterium]
MIRLIREIRGKPPAPTSSALKDVSFKIKGDSIEERIMTETPSISEAAVAYGTAVADLQQPLILQQQGQPLAVMVSFEEYQHWRVGC